MYHMDIFFFVSEVLVTSKLQQRERVLPSLPADTPSGLVMPVLFFRLCFLRLACGEGGGSSLGLVALPTLELAGSLIPLAEKTGKTFIIFFR